jgi:putative N6-adenine-specific DNA methylase
VQKFDEENADQHDTPSPQIVLVRLLHDQVTISVDSSGALLHRRGYRLATAKAPLRATLAAGMMLAAGWNPQVGTLALLLDPFCGAGTIAIEAAMLALGMAPGRQRRFAFMDWPDFDAALWHRLLAEADAQQQQRCAEMAGRLQILASDRDAGAIALAQENAARAGVADAIAFTHRALSAIDPPPGPGWVVTNPPYGVRVSAGNDLRNLYAQLGKVLRSRCPGWQVALLCNDRRLLGQTGLALDASLGLVNGGIAVILARGTIEHGSGK